MRFKIAFIGSLFAYLICFAQQEPISSTEALIKLNQIKTQMNVVFPENDVKTYQRASFNESQLQDYLSQHFQLMDLLPNIKGQHKLKLSTYHHSGNWFYKIGFPQQSNNAYKDFFKYYNAYENTLSEKEKQSYTEILGFAYSVMAENYAKLNYLDSAEITHLENIKFTKPERGINYSSALNNYGLYFYWDKNDLDQALYYFNKAYAEAQTYLPTHSLNGSIRDNIADIYFDQNRYPLALEYYKTNFAFYKSTPNYRSNKIDETRLVSAGAQLIITSANLKKTQEAEETLDALIEITETYKNQLSPSSKLEVLKAREALFLAQNNVMAAYNASTDILKLSESINRVSKQADITWETKLNALILDRVAWGFKIDQINKENKIKGQRLKLWIFALTFSIAIILLTLLFLRRRQRLINAKNKQLLAEKTLENTILKVKQLNSEIKSKERDLSDFAINLSQNQDWIEVLAKKIDALKTADQKERNLLLEDLEQEIHNKVSFDTNTKDFFERLDKLSDSFYSKLDKQFPNLSKNEIRLCSLIRLKIDSRSIAILQNISLASLNTSRYRLRKKMHLSELQDLDNFIISI